MPVNAGISRMTLQDYAEYSTYFYIAGQSRISKVQDNAGV